MTTKLQVEVEGCITDLRDLIAHRGRSVIMQKAIDLLILLKDNPVVTSSEVDELIIQLGPECSPGGQCDPKTLDRAIDALISLSCEKLIEATVKIGSRYGVLHVTSGIPTGVRLVICDYERQIGDPVPSQANCVLKYPPNEPSYMETVYTSGR